MPTVITEHYKTGNANRERVAQSCGNGTPIAKFYWDKNHRDGAEIHILYSNAVIEIYNAITNRLITKLIARPQQLKRYAQMGMRNELNEKTRKMRNWLVPQSVLNLALAHERKGMNHC